MKTAVALSLLLLVAPAAPLAAQETPEVEKLRATVEQLEKTVRQLQQRVDELEKGKAAQPAAATQPAAQQPPTEEAPLVPDYNTVADLQAAAPRPDNVSIEPAPEGFIPIPGTVSKFRFGGSARVDTIVDKGDSGNPNWFSPATMPVEGEPGFEAGGRSSLHAKGTRLNLEFRRPVRANDELRIFYENDFFGDSASQTMTYRLRHFYGQAANMLLGQTYSAFENIDSWPDLVDNLGPNAIVNRRQAQLRYTYPISREKGHSEYLSFSLETPTTEVDVDAAAFAGGTRTVNRLPDFVAGYRLERKRGHVQLAALGRSLGVESPDGARATTTGWGLNLSGALNVLTADKVSFQFVYGEGVGRYLNDTNGKGLDAAPAAGGGLEAVPVFAPMIAYGHHWSDRWRSTAALSLVRVDPIDSLGPSVIEETAQGSVNLVYQPTAHFRVGLEYLHARKEVAGGAKGDADRLDFVVKYDLVK